jgi:hypothetical protein
MSVGGFISHNSHGNCIFKGGSYGGGNPNFLTTNCHAMKTYVGVDVQISVFLILALVAEGSASRPGRFIPGIHLTGGCMDPRTSLDGTQRRKILPLAGLKFQPVACHCINCAIKGSH